MGGRDAHPTAGETPALRRPGWAGEAARPYASCAWSGCAFGGALQVGQHFFRVAFGLYFVEDVLDFAVRTDNKSGPHHAHHFLSVHVLFLVHVKGPANFLIGIGQQRERQFVLLLKFLLRAWSIRRDAQQHGAGILHLSIGVAELAGLDGAAGSIGSRIKIEHDVFSAKILERNFFTILVGQSKVRGFIIDIDGHGSVS